MRTTMENTQNLLSKKIVENMLTEKGELYLSPEEIVNICETVYMLKAILADVGLELIIVDNNPKDFYERYQGSECLQLEEEV